MLTLGVILLTFAPGDLASFRDQRGNGFKVEVKEARGPDSFLIEESWSERPPLAAVLNAEQLEQSLIGFSRENTQKYFAECESYGKFETIITPAGAFRACTIRFLDDPKSSYSISPEVPFGIVQRVDGQQVLQLTEFKFGAR